MKARIWLNGNICCCDSMRFVPKSGELESRCEQLSLKRQQSYPLLARGALSASRNSCTDIALRRFFPLVRPGVLCCVPIVISKILRSDLQLFFPSLLNNISRNFAFFEADMDTIKDEQIQRRNVQELDDMFSQRIDSCTVFNIKQRCTQHFKGSLKTRRNRIENK